MITIITLETILDIIEAMKSVPALAGYAASLEGPRTRGSTTAHGLDYLLYKEEYQSGAEFTPQAAAIPGCRYFKFMVPGDMRTELGAVPIEFLQVMGRMEEICVRKGAHGYELFLDVPVAEAVLIPVDHITVILGPDETGALPEIVWTWHPGTPLGSAKPGIDSNTGVKVHNG